MATQLEKARNAASLARQQIRKLQSPAAALADGLASNAGALTAGFVDATASSRIPGLNFKPSPIIGVAGVAIGVATEMPWLVNYAAGMLAPLAYNLGEVASDRFIPPMAAPAAPSPSSP